MEDLVSIILPVYNAEKFLNKCVQSILNQTYKNFELLIINDGSKDNSLQICQELAKTDNRIRVFDKQNGGCSTARNMGIENASGEYFTFIDPDDYMLPAHIECLVKAASKADMGIVDFLRTKPKEKYKENTIKQLSVNGKYVTRYQAKHITIEADEPMKWTLDGEKGKERDKAEIQVVPRALKIIC